MEKLLLNIKKLNLNFGSQQLFKDFNLQACRGEIIGFFAPTGSGKPSLFHYITEHLGERTDGVEKVFYVFQEPRLIAGATVLKNVMLPLQNKMNKEEAKETAAAWLEKLNLAHKARALAKDLSGGEQQRTSIARAFAALSQADGNSLLLLDEPFASQDEANIQNIITLTKQIVFTSKCTCLIISHDQMLLQSLCNRIITQDSFVIASAAKQSTSLKK